MAMLRPLTRWDVKQAQCTSASGTRDGPVLVCCPPRRLQRRLHASRCAVQAVAFLPNSSKAHATHPAPHMPSLSSQDAADAAMPHLLQLPSLQGEFDPACVLVAGAAEEQGPRRTKMLDRLLSIDHFSQLANSQLITHGAQPGSWMSSTPCMLTAVLDGHRGSKAVTHAAARFRDVLAQDTALWSHIDDIMERPQLGAPALQGVCQQLKSAFKHIDKEILDQTRATSDTRVDGTTALLGLHVAHHLFLANLGNSRAVLSRRGTALRLTYDHTPAVAKERERMLASGATLLWEDTRVALPGSQPGPSCKTIAVSRSLGDLDMKEPKALLRATPSCFYMPIHPVSDKFIIYASDGLWGVMDDQDAVDVVHDELEQMRVYCSSAREAAQAAATALVDHAREYGSTDDITVVVNLLRWECC